MCGIVYRKTWDGGGTVNKSIRKTYFKQKSRGSDGFGFIAIKRDGLRLARTIYEHDVMTQLKRVPSREILFHHRYPTSTKNSSKTNHPIVGIQNDYTHNYYLVHNGVIWNDLSIKKIHNEMGIEYSSQQEDKFNDSEVLLHELALCLEGIKKKDEFEARGSMAFILLQTDKMNIPEALYFGRNYQNPLNMDYDADEFLSLSSQGLGVEIKPHTLFRFDYKTRKITEEPFVFNSYYEEKGYSGRYSCYDDDYNGRYSELGVWTPARPKELEIPIVDRSDNSNSEFMENLIADARKSLPPAPMDSKTLELDARVFGDCIQTAVKDMSLERMGLWGLSDRQLMNLLQVIQGRKNYLLKVATQVRGEKEEVDVACKIEIQKKNFDMVNDVMFYDSTRN